MNNRLDSIEDHIVHNGLDIELFVCSEVLKLRSLHFGWWEPDDPQTLAGLRRAQARYTEKLLEHIPEGVQDILDVGAGLGDVAQAMSHAGYTVTAISPDRNHARYFERPELSRVEFVKARLEDFQTTKRFDLVLMSESQNYFAPEVAFSRTRALLRAGGHLLVCGMFRRCSDTTVFRDVRNIEDEFLARANQHEMSVVVNDDITEHVSGTVGFGKMIQREYVEPTLTAARSWLEGQSPWKARVVQYALRREWGSLERILQYYREFSDEELFRQHVRYKTVLFRQRHGRLQA